jgi:hypothetical protein
MLRTTAIVALLATGCEHGEGATRIAPAAKVTDEDGWRDVVAEHTRRDVAYDWLIRTADMRATIVTPALRSAYLGARDVFEGRFAKDMELELVAMGQRPDEGVDAPMVAGPQGEEEVLVFVAMYVTDRVNRDLGAGYTIWDKELVKGDAVAKPLRIENVKHSPTVVEMFPYVDTYDDLYILHFPLVDPKTGTSFLATSGPPVELRVTSALADCVVSWTFTQ